MAPEEPLIRWIDSHAHLTMFDVGERAAVLERAAAEGVGGVLVPATGPRDLADTLEMAAAHPDTIVGAAGVHPHEATALDASVKRRLCQAVSHDGMVAVGEIGLDYHYMNSPREDQLAACRWQLDLAIELGLPVILHNRESWHDLEGLLAERQGRLRGVCHSFAEGPAEAVRVVELGLLVGISGMVTFRAAHNIRELVAAVDPESVIVETDSPYLAPVPHRGRRNEPAYVVYTGRRVAAEWGVDEARVADSTTANFERLFGFRSLRPASHHG